MDKIEIENPEVASQIYDLLVCMGIRDHDGFSYDFSFTKEELDLVDCIYLEASENLEDLLKLPKLKKLKIKSMNQDTVVEVNPFRINSITDFSILSYLTSLEELTIVNDPNVETLVLSSLTKLKKIKLCNNRNLSNIIGLDKLKHLENILIYGNKKEPSIDPVLYLNNTRNASKNYLDITMFFDMMKKDNKFKERYLTAVNDFSTNLEFVEKVGIYNYYVPYRPSATIKLYEEARDILSSRMAIKLGLGTKEKIKSLYDYTRKKVKYDYDTLNQRDTNSLYEASSNKQKSYRMSLPNTSYSAIVNKKTVCEGYANMLHVLLHMIGVESRVIYCSSKEEFINGLNHAALRVKYHDEFFYVDSDPNWNKEKENFLVEKNEFEETHVLAASEKEIGNDNYDVKRYIKR